MALDQEQQTQYLEQQYDDYSIIDKIYFDVKNICKVEYQYPINELKKKWSLKSEDSKAFLKYLNNM